MSITAVRPRNVVSVAQVRAVLEGIAEEYPWRRDQRQREEHPPRYVEWGKPNCLVAMALLRLGFSLGLLRALDAEHPVGDLFQPGVRIAESRHPALARLDPAALALLAHVQEAQCRGRSWGRIVRDAFARSKWFPGRDLERKPWLTI